MTYKTPCSRIKTTTGGFNLVKMCLYSCTTSMANNPANEEDGKTRRKITQALNLPGVTKVKNIIKRKAAQRKGIIICASLNLWLS